MGWFVGSRFDLLVVGLYCW